MKTLYFECSMGASGDMVNSSLLELLDCPEEFIDSLDNFNLEGINIKVSKATKCGVTGTNFDVLVNGAGELSLDVDTDGGHSHGLEEGDRHGLYHNHTHGQEHSHNHEHSHYDFKNITDTINQLNISQKAKADAIGIYNLILNAEAHAHNTEPEMVHFHEVGHLDAIVDIVSACLLIEKINPDKIISSPINVGSGFVKCSHGILPVPAPATASILTGLPIYQNDVKGELCTPTGAAILKYFVSEFKPMPEMNIQKIGYGMGKKDFKYANILRAFLGSQSPGETQPGNNKIVEITCNIDDMTGEYLSFACEKLFESGALDVYLTPTYMKKNRPGHILTCLCDIDKSDILIEAIFKHTTTFGLRKNTLDKYILNRNHKTISTKYGGIRLKNGYGYGTTKQKPEYSDIAELAEKNNIKITDVFDSF